ncbi:MAG TPA: diacylglycerol kinase family protein [Opitutaceae bacterium]|nr:diacylglycerol kinase family protein [Opitutaceae bacterium]
MKTIVIINSAAGTVVKSDGKLDADRLRALFRETGLNPEIHYVPPEAISARLKEAVSQAPECLVVGGGDGTINSAARLLAGTRMTLGLLPFGTLNHFATDLNISPELEKAVATIAHGQVKEIDVGEVNGQIFLNNFSIGAYPAAVRERERLRQTHGHGKWRAMTLASFNVLRRLRRFRAQLEIDGQTMRTRTPFILVSNNHYAGHVFSRRLRERIDAGELWLYSTRAYHVLTLAQLGFRALLGKLETAQAFESRAARHISITLRMPRLQGAIDGELRDFESPLHLQSRPRALRVLVPADAA